MKKRRRTREAVVYSSELTREPCLSFIRQGLPHVKVVRKNTSINRQSLNSKKMEGTLKVIPSRFYLHAGVPTLVSDFLCSSCLSGSTLDNVGYSSLGSNVLIIDNCPKDYLTSYEEVHPRYVFVMANIVLFAEALSQSQFPEVKKNII